MIYLLFHKDYDIPNNLYSYKSGVKSYINRICELIDYVKLHMIDYKRININELDSSMFDETFDIYKFEDIINEG